MKPSPFGLFNHMVNNLLKLGVVYVDLILYNYVHDT